MKENFGQTKKREVNFVCCLTSNEADLPGALVLVCGVVRSGGLLDFGSWLELYGDTVATGFFFDSKLADSFGANSDAQLFGAGAGAWACGIDCEAVALELSLRLLWQI